MLQLDLISGRLAGTSTRASRFPFLIGRAPEAHLRLEEDGVWDQHAEIQLRDRRFVLEIKPGASLLLNGVAAGPAPVSLRNGDLLSLGAVQLRFGLAASQQKALGPREFLSWGLLSTIVLGQAALILWLLRQ